MSISIVGAGAWGTALANATALAGHEVTLIDRDAHRARLMDEARENAIHLPGVPLAPAIRVTAALDSIRAANAVLLVTPAQTLRQTAQRLAPLLRAGTPALICAKGIERETGLFMSDVLAEELPAAIGCILSGPSFAADVARGLPTAVVLASTDEAVSGRLAESLSSNALRIYHGTDVRGVEIGGAAKNVLAVGCGIVIGRQLGESARAALVARGFAEMMRFARAFGARMETLMGLSGLGDTVLTCGSMQSRNFAFGEALGRGAPVEEAAGGKLAEGAFTASALMAKARTAGVDMPVSAAIEAVIAGRLSIDEAVGALMSRPIKAEISL